MKSFVSRLLLAASFVASPAVFACQPVFWQPTGFSVGYSASGAEQNLPSNARGALYVDVRDGVPHAPSPDDFIVTDRTTAERLHTHVVGLKRPDRDGYYLVAPEGGFRSGHVYEIAISGSAQPGSTFAPSVRVAVGPPLSPIELADGVRIVTRRDSGGGQATVVVDVAYSGEAERYAPRLARQVTAPRTGDVDEIIGPCGPGPQLLLESPGGCHIVSARVDFPELTDDPVTVKGLACMGWFAIPLPAA